MDSGEFENPPSWLRDNFHIIEGGTHSGVYDLVQLIHDLHRIKVDPVVTNSSFLLMVPTSNYSPGSTDLWSSFTGQISPPASLISP